MRMKDHLKNKAVFANTEQKFLIKVLFAKDE